MPAKTATTTTEFSELRLASKSLVFACRARRLRFALAAHPARVVVHLGQLRLASKSLVSPAVLAASASLWRLTQLVSSDTSGSFDWRESRSSRLTVLAGREGTVSPEGVRAIVVGHGYEPSTSPWHHLQHGQEGLRHHRGELVRLRGGNGARRSAERDGGDGGSRPGGGRPAAGALPGRRGSPATVGRRSHRSPRPSTKRRRSAGPCSSPNAPPTPPSPRRRQRRNACSSAAATTLPSLDQARTMADQLVADGRDEARQADEQERLQVEAEVQALMAPPRLPRIRRHPPRGVPRRAALADPRGSDIAHRHRRPCTGWSRRDSPAAAVGRRTTTTPPHRRPRCGQ